MNKIFSILALLIVIDFMITIDNLFPMSSFVSGSLPSSSDVIFIKTVPIPETFIHFSWLIASLVINAPSFARVAMTVLLSFAATLALLLHLVILPIAKTIKIECQAISSIQMISFDSSQVDIKANALPNNEYPIEGKKLPVEETNILNVIEHGVIEHNVVEHAVIDNPRKMSYADAVGYENVKPKPNVEHYTDISWLFLESETEKMKDQAQFIDTTEESEEIPTMSVAIADLLSCKHSFAKSKANKAVEDLKSLFFQDSPQIPLKKMSYADAVGYELVKPKQQRNPEVVPYTDISMLFPEEQDNLNSIATGHGHARTITTCNPPIMVYMDRSSVNVSQGPVAVEVEVAPPPDERIKRLVDLLNASEISQMVSPKNTFLTKIPKAILYNPHQIRIRIKQ